MKTPMKKSTKILLTLGILLAIAIPVVAATGYLMTAPASDNTTVNPSTSPSPSPSPSPVPATLSKVTVSTQTLTVGQSLTITTTVSDHTAGIIVTFTAVTGGATVGTATTDNTGLASLTFQPPVGQTRYAATAVHP
jgi:hypothetical protein